MEYILGFTLGFISCFIVMKLWQFALSGTFLQDKCTTPLDQFVRAEIIKADKLRNTEILQHFYCHRGFSTWIKSNLCKNCDLGYSGRDCNGVKL